MTLLVSVDQVKAHVNLDHDLSDEDIELKIHGASAMILGFIKSNADSLVDSSGAVVADVPYDIQIATCLLVGFLFARRGEDGGAGAGLVDGYPPPDVRFFLHRYRTPTVT